MQCGVIIGGCLRWKSSNLTYSVLLQELYHLRGQCSNQRVLAKLNYLSRIRSPQLSFRSNFQPSPMLRPRRDTQKPSRYRSSSPPRLSSNNRQLKRPKIDVKNVDRNNVDQALAVIAPASECTDEPPTLISTELPQFEANYVQNRPGASRHTSLPEIGFFKLFFSDSVVRILSKETNSYAEFHLQNPPLSLHETRYQTPTTPAEIYVYLGIHLYFGLYPLPVRNDYWKLHKLGQFMGLKRF